MTLKIRPATAADAAAMSRVCLLTADAGKSAERLHDYPELPGLVYSVPYVNLPHTYAFVLEDEEVGVIVGYVIGAVDTRAYEKYTEENWFPEQVIRFPSPENIPDIKPADKVYLERLRNPEKSRAMDVNVAFSPAHLHINILESYQRMGWGRKMIRRAVDYLKNEKDLDRVWLKTDPRNVDARVFYKRLGFKMIEGDPDGTSLGLNYVNFH